MKILNDILQRADEAVKKPSSYEVYGPSSAEKPHVQTMKHKASTLDEAKAHAEKLHSELPEEHHRYVNVYGGGKKHFKDTRTKRWTSVKD